MMMRRAVSTFQRVAVQRRFLSAASQPNVVDLNDTIIVTKSCAKVTQIPIEGGSGARVRDVG
jgi:hypothetical protein